MECKNCKYLYESRGWSSGYVCSITHQYNPTSCSITSDEYVKYMDICYNCKHWYGGGDWGLSCAKNYYDCSSNGFRKACEQFERKSDIKMEA